MAAQAESTRTALALLAALLQRGQAVLAVKAVRVTAIMGLTITLVAVAVRVVMLALVVTALMRQADPQQVLQVLVVGLAVLVLPMVCLEGLVVAVQDCMDKVIMATLAHQQALVAVALVLQNQAE